MCRFRTGGYNTLVATCVGEEGLDIGEVDLIVLFDVSKSPIRLVQRMGRTGRKREGRIVVLVTEGIEVIVFCFSSSISLLFLFVHRISLWLTVSVSYLSVSFNIFRFVWSMSLTANLSLLSYLDSFFLSMCVTPLFYPSLYTSLCRSASTTSRWSASGASTRLSWRWTNWCICCTRGLQGWFQKV